MKTRNAALFVALMSVPAICLAENPKAAMPSHGQPAIAASDASSGGVSGTVIETKDVDTYTYVQVDSGSKKIWAAAPKFSVKVGDKVVVPEGLPMRDFHSKALDKTFDVVYFVEHIQVGDAAPAKGAPAMGHGASPHDAGGDNAAALGTGHSTASAGTVDLSNIKKADGGQTVAELFSGKTTLVGKDVVVRGRVVKFTPDVMGKNWLHVQDGTGNSGSNDLTVSTSGSAAVGNMVLVKGKLGADKDLGFGYHYDLIIEDASVAVE